MSALEDARRKPTHTELLESLTDAGRRRVLRLVDERSGAVPVADVADRLAASADGESAEAATRSAQVRLRHTVLPHLDDAGLVDWDRQDGTVRASDHPAYVDPQFRQLLTTEGENWDDVVACLADERRSTVLAVLEARGEPMDRTGLARRVAAEEGDATPDDVESLRAELHHVHLPKLAAAGLVAYDPDEGTVAYEGHPRLPRSVTLARSAL